MRVQLSIFHTVSSLSVAAAVVALGASCGSDGRPSEAAAPAESVLAAGPRAAEAQPMPAGLRAAYISAVQTCGAGKAYRVVRSNAGGWLAPNPRQAFAATLEAGSVRVASNAPDRPWSVSMELSGYGCEGHMAPPSAAAPEATANRVDYRRGGLSEWYVSGPLGLEQGFTLAAPPPCSSAAEREVSIELALGGGLSPAMAKAGDAVELKDSSGAVRLRYSDLSVHDAAGKQLPARISLRGSRLSLHVDDTAAAYPVVVDPLIWTEQARLVAGDGAIDDGFGYSVAVSGGTAVVGVYFAAAAYVFVQNGTAWTQETKLLPGPTAGGFGRSVAIDGDTIVVGAGNTQTMAGADAGAAYVFTRSAGMWTEEQELTASDGAAGALLGSSVAISGDTAVVGAPYDDPDAGMDAGLAADAGAAYVFVRAAGMWTEQRKLIADTPTAGDLFGRAVAIDGDTVVAGANQASGGGSGSATVFFRTVDVWASEGMLAASDAELGDSYGRAVGISGDTVIVGAPVHGMTSSKEGAAYVFTRSMAMWTEQQKLTASDAAMFGSFGISVGVSGDTAVVGSTRAGPGAAYAFTRSMAMWTEQQKLTSMTVSDSFGSAIALDGPIAVVGAYLDDTMIGTGAGAAYVFALQGTEGEPCATALECLSGFCADGVCCDTACGGGDPNDCQACSVAGGALSDGMCAPRSANAICRNNAGECDVAEVCDGTATSCPADVLAPDGTACAGGTCMGGVCVPDSGAGGNGGAGGGTAGAGTGTSTSTGTGGSGGPTDEGGCGCRFVGSPSGGVANGIALAGGWVALGLLLAVRRRPVRRGARR